MRPSPFSYARSIWCLNTRGKAALCRFNNKMARLHNTTTLPLITEVMNPLNNHDRGRDLQMDLLMSMASMVYCVSGLFFLRERERIRTRFICSAHSGRNKDDRNSCVLFSTSFQCLLGPQIAFGASVFLLIDHNFFLEN